MAVNLAIGLHSVVRMEISLLDILSVDNIPTLLWDFVFSSLVDYCHKLRTGFVRVRGTLRVDQNASNKLHKAVPFFVSDSLLRQQALNSDP